jgi:hypothetical protein
MLRTTATQPQRLMPCGYAVLPNGRAFWEHSDKSIGSRAT